MNELQNDALFDRDMASFFDWLHTAEGKRATQSARTRRYYRLLATREKRVPELRGTLAAIRKADRSFRRAHRTGVET